ncbi:MAG: M23 family metallopeptidase [Ilumatobacter sp.]|uniref:murein hydrolase activator EnvC family protein n=1 Tax=Ilumatobacter sp. TaxID=1967498 RepID=UPI0032985FE6
MSRTITHRTRRRVAVGLLTVVAVVIPGSAAQAGPCWRPPVVGTVTDPFRAPACPYCAGNRGLDYRVGANSQVRAVAAGMVTWSGTIAGTRYVVVRHGDGRRTTYGKLISSALVNGDTVVSGSSIGTASGEFYFGLRVGEEYRDPAPHLGKLVGRPRLVPVDGSTPRQPPPPALRCGVDV